MKALGVGVYSNTYCSALNAILNSAGDANSIVGTLAASATNSPNAFVDTNPTLAYAGTSNCVDGWELDVPNAIELNYKTPYKIPNDRTYAEIKCTTEQVTNAGSACTAHSSLNNAV